MSTEPIRILLPDTAATEALGAALARWLGPRGAGLVTLQGDLGAGKTTLVRGLLRALGVEGPIRSPSYTLLEPYQLGALRVLHMDFYRLQSPDELENLGLRDDPPEQSLWLVEWPERGGELLPAATLGVRLQHAGQGRAVELSCAAAERSSLVRLLAAAKLVPGS